VVLSLMIVAYFVMRTRKPINPRVALLNPTTTWPLATVIGAVVAAVVVFVAAGVLSDDPLTAVAGAGVVGFLVLLAGRTKVGTRVVYDRGGSFMPPGAVLAAGGSFALLFFAFTR
jgi:hypothetical protein